MAGEHLAQAYSAIPDEGSDRRRIESDCPATHKVGTDYPVETSMQLGPTHFQAVINRGFSSS